MILTSLDRYVIHRYNPRKVTENRKTGIVREVLTSAQFEEMSHPTGNDSY